jgi:lysophospholipase L1-like esterase
MKFLLYLILPVLIFSGSTSHAQNQWEEEIKAFEKSDSSKFPAKGCILLTGSSTIRLWESLPEEMNGKQIVNRGFGGSEISDLITYAPKIIYPYKPSKLLIYSGTNDLANGKAVDSVFNDFKQLYEGLAENLPQCKVYYISIQCAPVRKNLRTEMTQLNQLIKAYLKKQKSGEYIDFFNLLTDKTGMPDPAYFIDDQLHMNQKGYDKWLHALKPFLL